MNLFGETFPQWFSPSHPPSEPIKPEVPKKIILTKTESLIEDIYIDGLSADDLIDKLSKFKSNPNFKIEQSGYDRISIYKISFNEYEMSEKEYNKKVKEFDRRQSKFEKEQIEYNQKKEKYPILLKKYKIAKLIHEKNILKENLNTNQLELSRIQFEIECDIKKINQIEKEIQDEQ